MAIFRRNKTDQAGMPKEVQDYYKAEGRERTGVAWLLALGTLLITILVVLGLFMGGRWAFRQLKNNDDQPQVAVQEEAKDEASEQPSSSGSSSSGSGSSSQSNTGNSSSQPAPANGSSGSQSSGGATSTQQGSSTTNSSSSNQNLANTGPGDTLAIFAAVSVLAYFTHRRFLTN